MSRIWLCFSLANQIILLSTLPISQLALTLVPLYVLYFYFTFLHLCNLYFYANYTIVSLHWGCTRNSREGDPFPLFSPGEQHLECSVNFLLPNTGKPWTDCTKSSEQTTHLDHHETRETFLIVNKAKAVTEGSLEIQKRLLKTQCWHLSREYYLSRSWPNLASKLCSNWSPFSVSIQMQDNNAAIIWYTDSCRDPLY